MADGEPPAISLADRFREQSENFRTAAVKASYNAHRDGGYNGSWIERRPLRHVNAELPKFHGRNLKEIAAALRPNALVWDLGSGDRAVALSELVDSYPDLHLQGVGVTMPVERDDIAHPDNVTIVRTDVDEYLRTYDKSKRPQLIYMANLLEWVPHPLSTLKHAYNALDTNGILLANPVLNAKYPLVDGSGNAVEPSLLGDALKDDGYDVEIVSTPDLLRGVRRSYSVAIRKTENHPNLNLPITPVTSERLGIDISKERRPYPLSSASKDIRYLYQFVPKLGPGTDV